MTKQAQGTHTWSVQSISILPADKGAEVAFIQNDRSAIMFRSRRFGVGQRGAKSAALAKFASKAGFGRPRALYRYIAALPAGFRGTLFARGNHGSTNVLSK